VDEFTRGLKSVLASANEEAALMSLAVGRSLPSAYVTRVTLPGVNNCAIFMFAGQVSGRAELQPRKDGGARFVDSTKRGWHPESSPGENRERRL